MLKLKFVLGIMIFVILFYSSLLLFVDQGLMLNPVGKL